jgi:outer membrane protein assembly factor BamB
MRRIVPLAALVMASATLCACNSARSNGGTASGSQIATAASMNAAGFAEAQRPTEGAKGGSDWPRFLGPNANSTSSEKGINKNWNANPPKLLRRITMSDGGYAGPAVANGLIYIVDHNGSKDIVRAIDIKTGENAWTYEYEDTASANYGFARATPLIYDGKVWTLGMMGELNCLDAKTGAPIWSKNIVSEFQGNAPQWAFASSPVLDGQRLIVCPGGPNATVVALNKDTGAVIMKGGGSDKPGYATPVIATIGGKKQYVVFQATGVAGVDVVNGAPIWRYPWKTSYDVNAATPLVIGNNVFITSGYGTGCAMLGISGSDVAVRWQNKSIRSRIQAPIYYNGYIYGTGEPGNLTCLDPKTGDTKWQQAGFEWGGLVLADGVLIVFDGASGSLVMVEATPKAYIELGRFTPLGGKSWTAPIIAQGCLIVRNEKELAWYSLK